MNAQTLAQAILNKRNSLNPLIMPGQLTAEIGTEGMQEAINRRWIVADTDSGYLQVNNQLAVVEQLRAAAEICEACGEKACQCAERAKQKSAISDSHNFVNEHANRPARNVISEIGSFGTGNPGPSAAQAAPAPSAPAPAPAARPASPTSPGQARAEIGDNIAVVENGKTYQGRVAEVKDGRYTLSFGNDKPPTQRDYSPEEVRLLSQFSAKPAYQA